MSATRSLPVNEHSSRELSALTDVRQKAVYRYMATWDDITGLPQSFNGQVRLFPLPNLVLFPHAMQPLHIFEPRYCEMLLDAMASDQLITMATLVGGVADLMTKRPQIAPYVCIGRVVSHAQAEDGTHNILLVGARRGMVVREMESTRPFRMAQVEVQDDIVPVVKPTEREKLRRLLLEAFAAVIPATATVKQNLHELMVSKMGLGAITDIIAHTLGLTHLDKLRLLAERNVDRRSSLLIELLNRMAESGPASSAEMPTDVLPGFFGGPSGQYPPPFSQN